LISARRGGVSNNRLGSSIREKALKVVRDCYSDFGPTLACEKLAELHGLEISRESLRQLMIADGLWTPKRTKKKRVFQLRERRPRFGEMVQIDGSPHDWFEGRSPPCTLLVFIDDATGRLLYLRFVPAETTSAYMTAMKVYMDRYGRPVAVYSDRHSIFRINTEEPLSGRSFTQFGRALETFDIEAIHARTPQAKGRVERANKTLQDRLIKEMRLREMNTPAEANAFLDEYMERFNERFAVIPKSTEDAHRKLLHDEREVSLTLSIQNERRVSKNLICQYQNTQYQIVSKGQRNTLKGAKIVVCELLSGEVVLLRKGKELPYTIFQKGDRPSTVEDTKSINLRVDAAKAAQQKKETWKPKPDHPWRRQDFTKKGGRSETFAVG